MTNKAPVRTRTRPTPQAEAAPAPTVEPAAEPASAPRRLPNGRFGPKYCGNPRGRPRKVPDLRPAGQRVLDEIVEVKIGGKLVRMTMEEAFIRVVFDMAIKERDPTCFRIGARFALKRFANAAQASAPTDQVVQITDEPLTEAEVEMFNRFMASRQEAQE